MGKTVYVWGVDNELLSQNFRRYEFTCQCGCGANDISMDLVKRLQEVRSALGQPMKITSGVRCSSHNESVGGRANSSHLEGNATAVDIACANSLYRHKLLEAVFPVFDRVGIARTFIHMDVDSKTSPCVWVY